MNGVGDDKFAPLKTLYFAVQHNTSLGGFAPAFLR